MKPKVSVIVPVYNCEKYLEEAIKSLLAQRLKDCEFILINDGSNDRSIDIINKYVEFDKRIKLINQDNKGVSYARNLGIEVSKGDYIGFMDADDYIDFDMYYKLYNIAKDNELDLVISNFEEELEGKKVIRELNITDNKKILQDEIIKEILPQFLEHDSLNSVCNKLYRRNIIIENNIRFPIDRWLGEDGIFNINYFYNSRSLMYSRYTGYHYREVEGSATRNIIKRDYFDKALEKYNEDIPNIYYKFLSKEYIEFLKSNRLINNVISYNYILFNQQCDLSIFERYKKVKTMISNEDLRRILLKNFKEFYSKKYIYEKAMLIMIKYRLTLGIYLLTKYSNFKNN